MIQVLALSKEFTTGGVSDLTFYVAPGEIFVLLGPNGAGKSTTIKMLTGLLTPSSGTARVAGKDVTRDQLGLKRVIGYMAERPYLYEKLTGREFLNFIADVYGVPRLARDRRARELLAAFELGQAADTLIESYSHGMRQKVALAAVLIHEPAVLFLDEPTNGLDPRSARLVKDILRQIANRGATVFMTTHVLEIAEQMCDRVGILREGRLIALGTLDDLRRTHRLPGASLESIFLRLTGSADVAELGLYAGSIG